MNSWIGTVLALGLGSIYIAIGYPMYRRMVKPNPIYGFRIRQTLDDPDIWYPVNERSGKHLIVTGALLLLIGAMALIAAQSEARQQTVVWLAVVMSLLGPLYSFVAGYRMAKRLAQEKE